MKNKIIFLLSIALLLMGLSAFAQEDSLHKKDITSHKKDIMNNSSIHDVIKSFQDLYEENKSKVSIPYDEIKEICKNDKYCLETSDFLLFMINTMQVELSSSLLEEDILETLKNTKNYKQNLYDLKYRISVVSLRNYLVDFEAKKLEKLTEFDEIKAYILDMPMPYPSFIKAIKKMKETASSKEELDFVDSFMNKYTGKLFPQNYEIFREEDLLELIKDSNPFCPQSLIVDNYGYDNLCTLPFPSAIKAPRNDVIVPGKTINFDKSPTPKKKYSPKESKPEEEPEEETEGIIAAYFK